MFCALLIVLCKTAFYDLSELGECIVFHGDTLERELGVESVEAMQKILEEIGYRQVTLVDKNRVELEMK